MCMFISAAHKQAADVKIVSVSELVSELGVPRWLRAVPIGCFAVMYLYILYICEPLAVAPPPYGRYREQLEYTLIPCSFLHWAGL